MITWWWQWRRIAQQAEAQLRVEYAERIRVSEENTLLTLANDDMRQTISQQAARIFVLEQELRELSGENREDRKDWANRDGDGSDTEYSAANRAVGESFPQGQGTAALDLNAVLAATPLPRAKHVIDLDQFEPDESFLGHVPIAKEEE